MNFKPKLVSIILNCYNGEKFLNSALKSVKNQSYKNWELIFWDNRSKDNSKKILKSFKSKKFKYFLAKKHTTLYAARNLALKKTSGEFISFIDADDTWEKNKLTKQIKLFKHKNIAVVYGNLWIKNEKNKKLKKFINYKVKSGYIYDDLIKKYNIGILTSIIKKKVLHESKIFFDSQYNIIGDFDFFIRLSKKYEFGYISEPLSTYRIHEKNLSFVKKNLQIQEFLNWLKRNKKNLSKNDFMVLQKKLINLQFNEISLTKSLLSKLRFFSKYWNSLYSLKNILALFMPKFLLKKFVWFN